jgi:uncharacterized small protein (DUF1192 family)
MEQPALTAQLTREMIARLLAQADEKKAGRPAALFA